MFGYVLPPLDLLTEKDQQSFRAVYCGLCRCLGRRCGERARLILNYDFTYLAILLFPETLSPMGLAAPMSSLLSAVICVGIYMWKFRKSEN